MSIEKAHPLTASLLVNVRNMLAYPNSDDNINRVLAQLEQMAREVARSEIARSAGGGEEPNWKWDDYLRTYIRILDPAQPAPAAEGGEIDPAELYDGITDERTWNMDDSRDKWRQAARDRRARIRELEAERDGAVFDYQQADNRAEAAEATLAALRARVKDIEDVLTDAQSDASWSRVDDARWMCTAIADNLLDAPSPRVDDQGEASGAENVQVRSAPPPDMTAVAEYVTDTEFFLGGVRYQPGAYAIKRIRDVEPSDVEF